MGMHDVGIGARARGAVLLLMLAAACAVVRADDNSHQVRASGASIASMSISARKSAA